MMIGSYGYDGWIITEAKKDIIIIIISIISIIIIIIIIIILFLCVPLLRYRLYVHVYRY